MLNCHQSYLPKHRSTSPGCASTIAGSIATGFVASYGFWEVLGSLPQAANDCRSITYLIRFIVWDGTRPFISSAMNQGRLPLQAPSLGSRRPPSHQGRDRGEPQRMAMQRGLSNIRADSPLQSPKQPTSYFFCGHFAMISYMQSGCLGKQLLVSGLVEHPDSRFHHPTAAHEHSFLPQILHSRPNFLDENIF